jgi:tetratricopeptide (TPR) repeat protein
MRPLRNLRADGPRHPRLGIYLLAAWLALAVPASAAIPLPGPAVVDRPAVEVSIREPSDTRSPFPVFPSCEGPIGPLEKRLFADAADGRWHEHTLLAAALLASGVDHPETLHRYQRQVAELVDELRRSGEVAGPPLERAQAIFEFMHRRILIGGYQLDHTDLSAVLDRGRFNCVSASVLFNCLAGEFGLRTCGLEIPGHAMSRLLFQDGHFDVETTCPTWFRLRHDPQKQAELVRQSLGLRPDQARSQPREVSDVELVATIYYNRGIDLLSQKRFAEAAAANAKALRLDPGSVTARGNLLATLNNWAIDLATAGDYPRAAGLLARGMQLDSGYETFRANFVHVHYQWIEDLCRRRRFQDALDLLATAAQALPADPYFKQAKLDIYRRWAQAKSDADEKQVSTQQ